MHTTIASKEELNRALLHLSAADSVRLKQIAILRASGTGWAWEDLFNEAVLRSLNGTRKWPLSVPFVAFMAQTMRSIAYEERDAAKNFISAIGDKDAELELYEYNGLVDIKTPERQLESKQILSKIEALFDDDPIGLSILLSTAEAHDPSEICVELGLTKTQYASALRRIRRRILAFKENLS